MTSSCILEEVSEAECIELDGMLQFRHNFTSAHSSVDPKLQPMLPSMTTHNEHHQKYCSTLL
jgi:hypothetical protein